MPIVGHSHTLGYHRTRRSDPIVCISAPRAIFSVFHYIFFFARSWTIQADEDIWVHCVWEQWISADDELSLHDEVEFELCVQFIFYFILYSRYFISHFQCWTAKAIIPHACECTSVFHSLRCDCLLLFFVLITFHVLAVLQQRSNFKEGESGRLEHDRLMPKSLWLTNGPRSLQPSEDSFLALISHRRCRRRRAREFCVNITRAREAGDVSENTQQEILKINQLLPDRDENKTLLSRMHSSSLDIVR